MATKDSIMKQSIFFWVFGHRLSFEYGLKKFIFGAWRNLSGALRELILKSHSTDWERLGIELATPGLQGIGLSPTAQARCS